MPSDPTPSVEVFRSRGRKPCLERALVLQAVGVPHQVVGGPGGSFLLLVPSDHAEAARRELSDYREENVDWPPRREPAPVLSHGRAVAATWVIVLTAIHPAGQSGFRGTNIWDPGKLIAGRVLDGEWWRAITALTLHGGVGHLVSNLVSGTVFLVLCSHSLGGGLALLGTVLAGVGGNLLNACIQDPRHSAIGASTAVFGALGLLVAYEYVRRHALGHSPARRFALLLAGGALLGYLGMGGGDPGSPSVYRTDVLAHVTGFVVGGLLGLAAGWSRLPDRLGQVGQRACAMLTGIVVAVGWVAALGA